MLLEYEPQNMLSEKNDITDYILPFHLYEMSGKSKSVETACVLELAVGKEMWIGANLNELEDFGGWWQE